MECSSECSCESGSEAETTTRPKVARHALRLSCWQQTVTSDEAEDSDAGKSDSCHLLGGSLVAQDSIIDEGELNDLLATSWYQPQLSSSKAIERLRQMPPGTFLVRRKASCFQLCLRTPNKVKHFSLLYSSAPQCYKLKGAKKQFSTLRSLIIHHSVMAEQLPLTLSLPRDACALTLSRQSSTRHPDDFDVLDVRQVRTILRSWSAT